MQNKLLTTNRKALIINLDDAKYGTLAEIGAGQETARCFFQVSGSAGTVAKSISAYDMKFSDEIYGRGARYVSEERLTRMIQYEFDLLNERLAEARGQATTFFAFANTVAAVSYRGTPDCHGWLGIRFQSAPLEEPSNIVIHVRMRDKENLQQQQALGIIGVNLIYGAFYLRDDLVQLISSLHDNLSPDRMETDMIRFSGPAFADVDNRLMCLQLVRQNLTPVVMFSSGCNVVQPSELLYKKAVLVERGRFRPFNRVNLDMLEKGLAQFSQEPEVTDEKIVVLTEMTIKNLLSEGELDNEDFLARIEILCALGFNVMISDYPEYYRLANYFRRFTRSMIGVVMGVNNLVEVFDEKYYENLPGGILESFGRLFRDTVKLYVYPMRRDALERYITFDEAMGEKRNPAPGDLEPHEFVTAENLQVFPHLRHLYLHLKMNDYITSIENYDRELPELYSPHIITRIREGDMEWENLVPPKVAEMVKKGRLFGYGAGASPGAE